MPVCSPKLTKAPISAVDGIKLKKNTPLCCKFGGRGERRRIQTLKKKEGELEEEEVKI